MREALLDTKFENGFELLYPDATQHRKLSGILDYDGDAKDRKPVWQMSQWWNPIDWDFINANCTKGSNGFYLYENGSRKVFVNQSKSTIILDLDASKEYDYLYGRPRVNGETWSHVLLEQNLEKPIRLINARHIIISLDYCVNFDVDKLPGQKIPCAQSSWYFTITNPKNGDSAYESMKEENPNEYFWFGVPLYDSRYKTIKKGAIVDKGFTGATNKLIYSIGTKNYINGPIKVGQTYHLEIDILPFIRRAFIYGKFHGALRRSKYRDLYLNYTNIGWEIPGSFSSSITYSNISIKAVEIIEHKD